MAEARQQSATITLLVVHGGELAASSMEEFVAGADEIIEVTGNGKFVLSRAIPAGANYRRLQPSRGGLAHALNLGVSFASCEWVVICFGDEVVGGKWLDGLLPFLGTDGAESLHLFHSGSGSELPLVVVRRQMFAYGAFDERFACGRLAALHWAFRIFPRPVYRISPDECISSHCCDWLRNPDCPPVDSVLDALLNQALTSGATTLTLAVLREAVAAEPWAPVNPYRAGAAYDAREFWDSNFSGYIRWEIYQPDEPEILGLLDRITPDSVLELGCGAGRNTRYFAAAERYAGIDLSMNLLRRAAERQEPNSHGILCGDITSLPVADASFELVFADSTVQHVTPEKIRRCAAEIARVSSEYICVIEYTEEEHPEGEWFKQIHMFAHNYRSLFEPYCELVWHAETSVRVHPARKELFLFRKRQQG